MTTIEQPAASTGVRSFDEVTEVTAVDQDGRFTADLDPRWTVGGKPNGGVMVAMLGRAASLGHPTFDLVGASTHFLSAPDPGPVDLVIDTLRAGRSVTVTQPTTTVPHSAASWACSLRSTTPPR